MAIILRQTRLTHGYNTQFFDSLVDVASFLALEPTDEKSDPHSEAPGSSSSDPPSDETWKSTPEAFDKLLTAFSPDREKAAEEYELQRRKTQRYFEWRGCHEGDQMTDIVFDRVTRKLDEGQLISNLKAYFYSVAKYVFLEWIKEQKPEPLDDGETGIPVVDPEPLDDEKESPRIRCFDECLAKLSTEDQKIIIEYYTGEKHEKIERRTKLAKNLNHTMNALRIRAHRIRKKLEACVKKCVSEKSE